VIQEYFHVSCAGLVFELKKIPCANGIKWWQLESIKQFLRHNASIDFAFFGFGQQVDSADGGWGHGFLRLNKDPKYDDSFKVFGFVR
jgi:hypothetical protein